MAGKASCRVVGVTITTGWVGLRRSMICGLSQFPVVQHESVFGVGLRQQGGGGATLWISVQVPLPDDRAAVCYRCRVFMQKKAFVIGDYLQWESVWDLPRL